MILNFIRFLLLVLLVIIIFIEVKVPPILALQNHQLILAIIIVLIIVIMDEIIGFLLGLIFLIIYFKHYQNIINNSSSSQKELSEPLMKAYNPFNMNNIDKFSDDVKPIHNNKTDPIPSSGESLNENNNCIIMPYISTELLEKAQNNIYDNDNYYKEIKNIENAYGVQGLNSDQVHYNAFDKTNITNNY
jgi:hypothetical protein